MGDSKDIRTMTNYGVRRWYLAQIELIGKEDQTLADAGASLEQRARIAHEKRESARVQARKLMPDQREVALLEARDSARYGSPQGPSFNQLLNQYLATGVSSDVAYLRIIQSAYRTDSTTNQRFAPNG